MMSFGRAIREHREGDRLRLYALHPNTGATIEAPAGVLNDFAVRLLFHRADGLYSYCTVLSPEEHKNEVVNLKITTPLRCLGGNKYIIIDEAEM